MLETSAKHHITQATNVPYQPFLIKPINSVEFGSHTTHTNLTICRKLNKLTNFIISNLEFLEQNFAMSSLLFTLSSVKQFLFAMSSFTLP